MRLLGPLIILLMLLTSCLAPRRATPKAPVRSGSSVVQFNGINGITNITDSTATLHWTHEDGIVEYVIYLSTGGPYILVEDTYLFNGINSYTLTGLTKETSYLVKLAKIDLEGIEVETAPVVFATNSYVPGPSNFTWVNSTSTYYNSHIKNPIVRIKGLSPGDNVLVSGSSCGSTNSIYAEVVAASEEIELSLQDLPLGQTTIYAAVVSSGGTNSSCPPALTYLRSYCPSGYVWVNAGQFCVMKYEARAWKDTDGDGVAASTEVDSDGCSDTACKVTNWGVGTWKPGSTSSGHPWRNLSFSKARQACRTLGQGYDLISNDEWMAMARGIETSSVNWIGLFRKGCLRSGNTGTNSDCSYSKGSIDTDSTQLLKRFHYVHTGSSYDFVYDLVGNLSEWVGWSLRTGVESKTVTCNLGDQEIPSFACADFAEEEYLPTYNFDSTLGYGRINAVSSGYAIRGGHFNSQTFAGIFSLDFIPSDSYVLPHIGFRCVYHP